jgi:hypothetical protein
MGVREWYVPARSTVRNGRVVREYAPKNTIVNLAGRAYIVGRKGVLKRYRDEKAPSTDRFLDRV